ncbi:MAG TPA: alpha/beta fold hydrolase [Candidatus Limnocylindrales bacterium]|nr:alpha/beta fold hydrolase [Candidatus Limnocylindrales bacterium]
MAGVRTLQGAPPPPGNQRVQFCRGAGGVRIAWAVHGSGPPLVIVSCWLGHLQYDWQSPVWRHFLDELGEIATVVRYDERGFGMSDWAVDDFSIEARLSDLEAVVAASGFERFALLGMSGGAPVALAYAATHPERVSRIVLYGASPAHRRQSDPERDAEEAVYREMIRVGWAKEDRVFRNVFTRKFIPDATEEQIRWFDDLQRMATSPETAVASRIQRQKSDVTHLLGRITCPTVILQATGDRVAGFQPGPDIAARLPAARLVPLESSNHILLADEPAWRTFMDEVRQFLAPDRAAGRAEPAIADLSERELEVLRIAARGKTNDAIAAELGLSVRTVERHLSNVYEKLGHAGKSARTAAVADLLRRELA